MAASQADDLIAQVTELARGPFTERAPAVDRDGVLSMENIQALRDLGIPTMALPVERGGLGFSVAESSRVMEAVAYGCGSTAVALNMHVLVADSLNFIPSFPRRDAVLDDIAHNGALICQPGSVPLGELDTRTVGFRFAEQGGNLVINGKSGFASMSDAASYILVVGAIENQDGGDPDVVIAIPSTDAPGLKIQGNWNGMGLRGTASHDISLTDVVIPREEALVMPLSAFHDSTAGVDRTVSNRTHHRYRGLIGGRAVWLGLAQAAFDFTLDYSSKRYGAMAVPPEVAKAFGAGGDGLRSSHAWAQIDIGHMAHWIDTSRILFYDFIDRVEQGVLSKEEEAVFMTRTTFHLRRMSEEVAQLSMRVCGAHAFVKTRPLERIVRDLIGCNVMSQKTEELAHALGKNALGIS